MNTNKNNQDNSLNLTSDSIDNNFEDNLIQEDLLSSSEFKGNYVKKADVYKDLKYSAFSLTLVGLAGDIYLVLKAFDIIGGGIDGFSDILFIIVMGALFNVFFISGIMSYLKSKKVHSEIDEEENMTTSIISYFDENIVNKIEASINHANSNEANLYYARTELMRNEIISKFGEMDSAYLDDIIETLYSKLFE